MVTVLSRVIKFISAGGRLATNNLFTFTALFSRIILHFQRESIENSRFTMSEVDNQEPAQLSITEYVEDGTNKLGVKCKYCGSKMLDKNCGHYIAQEIELPLMLQDSRKGSEVQKEKLTDFYHIKNMFTFDNISFTHTVGNTKYLCCADCDAGPVGYFDSDTKHSYIALSRIVHE